jgi:two-component system, OmpR family, sensor histidine kinase CreC
MREALNNIIRNALEFCPPLEGKVTISLERINESAQCTITDNGPGIPEWALPKIFDQFFSLPRTLENRKSSGLGLSISKEVIDRMGGSVTATNISPHGAQVTMVVPIGASGQE